MKRLCKTGQNSRFNYGEARVFRGIPKLMPRYGMFHQDAMKFLSRLPRRGLFDLVITSPPYNIGKEYEKRVPLPDYLNWQREMINEIVPRVRDSGSICWEVGNFVENGVVEPLDIWLHPLFKANGLHLRNRIVWHFGHGLHCQRRFSGRYETVLWYTKSDNYIFDLDSVRVQSKYPGKRHYKGPHSGKLSSNPSGKNPEDVWEFPTDMWNIPNVKCNHKEKTDHPCQFPVGLAERLILALSKRRGLVFDPFAGVGSAGVAAALHGRDFWGCEIMGDYVANAKKRIDAALNGEAVYRPHDQPLYDHTTSPLSVRPAK